MILEKAVLSKRSAVTDRARAGVVALFAIPAMNLCSTQHLLGIFWGWLIAV